MTAFTIRPDALHQALANVLPHTDGGALTPVLAAIEMTVAAGTLTTAATDRYTLGRQSVDVVPGAEAGRFLMPSTLARDVVKACKAQAKTPNSLIAVAHRGQTIEVTWPGGSLSAHTVDGDFPKYGTLWPKPTEAEAKGEIALGTRHLGKFGKIYRGTAALRHPAIKLVFSAGRKPVLATVDGLAGFDALVMPVHVEAAA